jgi:hypothetical protein
MLLKRTSVYLRIVTHFANRIGGVMVSMLASSAVDIEFESQQIDMSPHSDKFSRFQANQSLFFLLNAACLAEKQQNTNSIVFDFTRPWLELNIYRTRREHANHYTTNAVCKMCNCCFSAKHAALRRKNKDWLAWNRENLSE